MRRFRGESFHKVDGKGRVSIPAPFRRVLEEGDPDCKSNNNPTCVLVYGRKGKKCLEGYSIQSMDEVDNLVSLLPRYSNEREMLERMLNAQSIYSQLDENGRLVLSSKLRELVDIKSEAVFVGMGDKFQIWEPELYRNDMGIMEKVLSTCDKNSDPFSLLKPFDPGVRK